MNTSPKRGNVFSFILGKLSLYTSGSYINYRIRSLMWFFVKRRFKSIIYQFDKNIKIKLYTNRQLSRLIYCNQFEKDEFDFINKYVKKDSVVYDIGANIGLHSLFLANHVGGEGVCYSFEPIKDTFESLNENVLLNGITNIHTFNLALSDREETLQMYKSVNGYDAWNSLGGLQKGENNKYDLENVKCIPLDTFLKNDSGIKKPDFIKMDTEGWELHVLKGCSDLLKNNSLVLMIEYSKKSLTLTNTKQSDLSDYLTSLGYKLYQYDYKNNRFTLIDRQHTYEYINVIATKEPL